jgi:hypothetical protein
MYGSIFGFQREQRCPKWTPASTNDLTNSAVTMRFTPQSFGPAVYTAHFRQPKRRQSAKTASVRYAAFVNEVEQRTETDPQDRPREALGEPN